MISPPLSDLEKPMTKNAAVAGIDRRTLVSGVAAISAGGALTTAAQAQTKATSPGLSFAVCGDSRPMMYLPYTDGNPDLVRLFVEMFGLVMPERVAEEVVKRDVKMIVDPVTKDLVQIIMPFMSKSEIMTLSVDQGWVTRATVEDVKLLPGVHREVFRLEGGEWVSREIVQHVQAGRAKFVINSGDVVWWGNQGLTINDSPYWKRLNDSMLKLLPEPDAEMRAAGLEGRWFMSVGNHEVWGDPKIEGVLGAVPYLRKFGVTPESMSLTSKTYDSFSCGAANTTTAHRRCGTRIGRSTRSRSFSCGNGWTMPKPRESRRPLSPFIIRSSAAPALAPSQSLTIPTK
jgi:hypothetical protein